MTAGEELGVRYRELAARIGAFAARRVLADEVDDIVSETFTRAFGRIELYAHRGSDIGAWLIAIASNIIIDSYRRQGRRPEIIGDIPEQPDRIIDLDQRLDVHALIAALPEKDQRFVDARWFNDHYLADVGLGLSPMQAWRTEKRVLATLRRLVDA